jgi:hypothetical protein
MASNFDLHQKISSILWPARIVGYFAALIFFGIAIIIAQFYSAEPTAGATALVTLSLFFSFFIIVYILFVIGGKTYDRVLSELMEDFATNHNMSFQKKADKKICQLYFANYGRFPRLFNYINGEIAGMHGSIFNYQIVIAVGSGSSENYNFTVCKINLPHHSPDLLLESRSQIQYEYNFLYTFQKTKMVKLSIPSEFDAKYNLWSDPSFNIETLQIFSPTFMKEVLDNYENINMQIVNNDLYFYKSGLIESHAELNEFLELSKNITIKMSSILKQVSKSSSAIKNLKINKSTGK